MSATVFSGIFWPRLDLSYIPIAVGCKGIFWRESCFVFLLAGSLHFLATVACHSWSFNAGRRCNAVNYNWCKINWFITNIWLWTGLYWTELNWIEFILFYFKWSMLFKVILLLFSFDLNQGWHVHDRLLHQYYIHCIDILIFDIGIIPWEGVCVHH